MPVVVSCRCGKRFAAKDQLVGQKVPCPGCGTTLTISATDHDPSEGVYVSCRCGRAFLAPPELRGQQARCRGCGAMISVPPDDRIVTPPTPSGSHFDDGLDPLASPNTAPHEDEIPWDTLKLIAKIGAVALGLLIAFTIGRMIWSRANDALVAQRIEAARRAEQVKIPPPKVGPSPVAPPSIGEPVVDDVKAATPFDATSVPKTTAPIDPALAASIPVVRLPDGIQSWYEQPGDLTGIRRVSATDTATTSFSWLTGLLPYIGHGQVHQRFDFTQPMTKGRNLELGGTLIPEFINPLDDYQRWKGYPFDGMALTHFVGISGVEDARNVVAAKLPRSDPRAGVFGYDEVARLDQITDGASQTIMVAGAGALPNPWTFGGGATIRAAREPLFDKTSGLGTRGLSAGGTLVVMADGSVRHVHGGVDPRVFRAMCTIHGAETVDLEEASKPFALEGLKSEREAATPSAP
jgi:hypothetical protein